MNMWDPSTGTQLLSPWALSLKAEIHSLANLSLLVPGQIVIIPNPELRPILTNFG